MHELDAAASDNEMSAPAHSFGVAALADAIGDALADETVRVVGAALGNVETVFVVLEFVVTAGVIEGEEGDDEHATTSATESENDSETRAELDRSDACMRDRIAAREPRRAYLTNTRATVDGAQTPCS